MHRRIVGISTGFVNGREVENELGILSDSLSHRTDRFHRIHIGLIYRRVPIPFCHMYQHNREGKQSLPQPVQTNDTNVFSVTTYSKKHDT